MRPANFSITSSCAAVFCIGTPSFCLIFTIRHHANSEYWLIFSLLRWLIRYFLWFRARRKWKWRGRNLINLPLANHRKLRLLRCLGRLAIAHKKEPLLLRCLGRLAIDQKIEPRILRCLGRLVYRWCKRNLITFVAIITKGSIAHKNWYYTNLWLHVAI